MQQIIFSIVLVFNLFFSFSSRALTYPESQPVPGGIIRLVIGNTAQKPVVTFRGKPALLIQQKHQWIAIIGLPLSLKPGRHHVSVLTGTRKKRSVFFEVLPMNYPEQHITLKNKRMVNPNHYDMKRIRKDRKQITRALTLWKDTPDVELEFIKPVNGRYSSHFGLRRFFNGQARRPHSGLDIAAPAGTAILTPAAGTVISTGHFFFNGKTVFIDHGQGLISMYCHLQKIRVKTGQKLLKGSILGEVGQTGRVTGPHLHWSVSLNNSMVNPSLFLPPALRPVIKKTPENNTFVKH